MTKLKTFNIRGHAHFVTTAVFNRVPLFRQPACADILLDNLNFYRNKYNFKLLGYVIMPDYLHCLILPSKRGTISEIMRDFKKYTAIQTLSLLQKEGRKDWLAIFAQAGRQTGRSKNKVWLDGFYDFNIFSEEKLREKLVYMPTIQ